MIYKHNLGNILNELNVDLSWEYAAAIQYMQHASMLSGATFTSVIDELNIHANEEFAHAHMVNELIAYLGGVPTIQVAPRLVSPDNTEMLRQDLQGEYDAIKRYLSRISQLESIGLYDSAQRLRNIVVEEQEHAMDLEIILGISRESPVLPHTQKVYAMPEHSKLN